MKKKKKNNDTSPKSNQVFKPPSSEDRIAGALILIIGLIFFLIGAAMIETPFFLDEFSIGSLIFGIFCGIWFLIPGGWILFIGLKGIWLSLRTLLQQGIPAEELEELKNALNPGFREARDEAPMGRLIQSFRQHYSDFYQTLSTEENAPIQQDVTQIFRNIMEYRKNRLARLGITCEMRVRRMAYQQANGLSDRTYSDGKYNITEVKEEIAAKTVYRRGDKIIRTRIDRDVANYTIIDARQVGGSLVVCPNCGAETTREDLLDGCDYCGTRFRVEDLSRRIAAFAFRADYKLAFAKYEQLRRRFLTMAAIGLVLAVTAFFLSMAVPYSIDMIRTGTAGVILTVLSAIFATAISVPVYMLSWCIVYGWIVLPLAALFFYVNRMMKKYMEHLKEAPQYDRSFEEKIRRSDEHFSLAGFYVGLQNKIASILYAETQQQLEAFTEGASGNLLKYYENVFGFEVDHMEILDYRMDQDLQQAEVSADLTLTELRGERCHLRRERWKLSLAKSAQCRTQVVCAPAIMTCRGCGSSLDLLKGKTCEHCGCQLDLKDHDWVIRKIQRKKRRRI